MKVGRPGPYLLITPASLQRCQLQSVKLISFCAFLSATRHLVAIQDWCAGGAGAPDGVDQEDGSEALHSVNVLSSWIGLEMVEI